MDENGLIGKNNDLPWRLPSDLKRVKMITTGHTIVMGRKNYESIGRPLPNRLNVILTRNKEYHAEGCEVIHTPEAIFEMANSDVEVFIFGGTEIYKLFLPYVQSMYVTKIHHSFEGDTYFPSIDWDEWKEISKEEHHANEKDPHDFSFLFYERSE